MDLQGELFMRVQVGNGVSAAEQEAERAIKTIVRYHDGNYYVVLINTRLNEQLPQSATTGTTRYTEEGKTQVFIPTNDVRLMLPVADVLTDAEELSPLNGGTETAQTLETVTIQGIGTRQRLTLPTLAPAATRVFRFRAVQPAVTVAPMLLATEQQKNDASINAESPNERRNINKESHEESLTIFPNPARETTTLRFPPRTYEELPTLTIADMYGNIIVQREISASEIVLNTRPFPSGVYVCSLRSRRGIQTTLLHIIK